MRTTTLSSSIEGSPLGLGDTTANQRPGLDLALQIRERLLALRLLPLARSKRRHRYARALNRKRLSNSLNSQSASQSELLRLNATTGISPGFAAAVT